MQYWCRECSNRAAITNYQENKDRYFEKAKKRNSEMREWLNELKNRPCTDCGFWYPAVVMDFDHVQGKVLDISEMRRRRMARSKIEAEVAKCELVCANCHRLRTQARAEGNF